MNSNLTIKCPWKTLYEECKHGILKVQRSGTLNFVDHQFYIYIMTNMHNNVLYVGSTGNLKKRIYMHRNRLIAGFTKKYNLCKLVYFEFCGDDEQNARSREHQIKAGSRANKIKLVESMAKPWEDAFDLIK